MVWLPPLALAEAPTPGYEGTLRPQYSPHCIRPRRPSPCPRSSFATWAHFEGLTPPLWPTPSPSFSSLGW